MAKNVWAIQPIDRLEGRDIATEFPGIFKESENKKIYYKSIWNNKLLLIITISPDSKITAWAGCKGKDPD